jgi:hypothetical protein
MLSLAVLVDHTVTKGRAAFDSVSFGTRVYVYVSVCVHVRSCVCSTDGVFRCLRNLDRGHHDEERRPPSHVRHVP